MKIKKIEWEVDYEDENCIYGYFNSRIRFFAIEKYGGYWEVWSKFLHDNCSLKEEDIVKKFRKLENAKKYCIKLMEKFHNLFFEC